MTKELYAVQRLHLAPSNSRINGDDWMRGLILQLIHISHSQWLFQNFTLHDKQCGYRRLKDRAEVLVRIDKLWNTDPDRIPDHSKFLLEIDTERLIQGAYNSQVYWVTAMEAARRAPAAALMGLQFQRPPLSKFGTFVVREQICQEVRVMLGTNDTYSSKKQKRSDICTGGQQLRCKSPKYTDKALTESDRRWKPD